MSSNKRARRALTATGLALALVVPLSASAYAAPGGAGYVEVVHLGVDGRYDSPEGLDNPRPTLSWQMAETRRARSHACHRPGAKIACPADKQTAYEVQAADTVQRLKAGDLIWETGRVNGSQQRVTFGRTLGSRATVAWRVRVWDADRRPSEWSEPATWSMGLLQQGDWGSARWIDYPDRTENQPMPIFARQFDVPRGKKVADARLYLSGVGLHHATVNGKELTDEVLAPGNSNYQLSSEYRTYDVTDVLRKGGNTVGVELGNGPAYVRRSVTNPAVGRTSPYSWWQSQLKGNGVLAADAAAGATTVKLDNVSGYHVGGTINIDTGGGGDRLESRRITAIGTAGADGTGITFTPGLSGAHAAGAKVTGSGNNIAASDASAGAAVTPRFIGRMEITYRDGSTQAIVTDRSWRAALGPLVTDAWYSGSDYDARREQPGWDEPGSDLSPSAKRRDGSRMEWTSAGIAPPPNLATKLVARTAEPVVVKEELTPVSVTNPAPGTWVFDFGQNIVGWPKLNLDEVPAGTTVKVAPAESLNADGTVNQASLMGGGGSRGVDLFNTYTAYGASRGESWHPDFNYFGMQWVQVTGLPDGYKPTRKLVTGVRLQADTPAASEFTSSNARINRIHKMSYYSIAGNIMSVFTDCPGREKLSYPADYTMPMGAIHRNFELAAYMRTTMRHLVEGQSLADTPMAGNVALKTPVYDWGYSGRFGDEINWGNAIVLVPSFLYELYGDTQTMTKYYDQMVKYIEYIQREKVGTGANEHIVDAALADWVAADQTSGRITGTWGYYVMISKMARMAELTGHTADAQKYWQLASDIKQAFNKAFFNESLGRYTATGNAGTAGATQTAQALALDAGLVPDDKRKGVLDALVELVYAFHPNGDGPHFSGGTIGMAPTVRALAEGGRDDVLWDVLQENDQPSYGYFMESTTANPGGMTTIGERWTRGDSKNHMILAQIEEWFQSHLAGIRAADGSTAYNKLVFQPKPVGDLRYVQGGYQTPQGTARSSWTKTDRSFELKITVPANTTAEVRVPTDGGKTVLKPARATFLRNEAGYSVYSVPSGEFTFTATKK
ncbi:alpha-L-rhamnosidase [Thermomonospora echinospora]|uniref:alpha-L-rhamnosidase n=1 Tax=Thermomonospora echinospora TaxID=1992 RepID=A0A1H6DJZ1_9ACTN|nr:alpha-L-rhamnosidase [Thermomonospora echinospora]SEG85572.1 alpha-L-rhamnosidase [Thermomonospora echinospora]